MKYFILLLTLVSAYISVVHSDSPSKCSYTATDSSEYSLAGFNRWITARNGGSVWYYINPCPGTNYGSDNTAGLVSPLCSDGSGAAVCRITSNGEVSVRGLSEGALWSDYKQPNEGVEVLFASNETCKDGFFKTDVLYICDDELDFPNAVVSDETDCLTTIRIYSSHACPIEKNSNIAHHRSRYVSSRIPLYASLLAFLVLMTGFICCCSAIRRCRQKRLAMKQFSNIAFQPIPFTQSKDFEASGSLPSYNPYVSQPQYFYYYPNQHLDVPNQVQLESQVVPQPKSDEELAMDLQAQFDQETRI